MTMSRPVRILVWLAVLAALLMAALSATTAHAATTGHRWQAWEWAKAHQGAWYVWGGTGPGFDCSGLAYASYGHGGGIWLPRTTYGMLGSWRAQFVSHAGARMGDLVFFGSGHVELYAGWHTTYGAQQPGTRVGYHHWYPGSGYVPTAYVHISGTG